MDRYGKLNVAGRQSLRHFILFALQFPWFRSHPAQFERDVDKVPRGFQLWLRWQLAVSRLVLAR